MALTFNGSPTFSLGIEIELQILNPETLDLIPRSELLLNKAIEAGLQRVKAEIHQSMLEIDSEISKDVKECKEYLRKRGGHLNAIAQQCGLELAILGTHPFQRWTERIFSPGQRYQNLHQRYQWLARRMNVYGLHVHVGVKNGYSALAITSAAVKFLPYLLALSGNSPFWQGYDTGMNSSRMNVMNSFPLSGLPVHFENWNDFEYYFENLRRAGIIQSMKDFYWPIRPNLDYGTVEFRICDALSSLDETMALAALSQCLVAFLEDQIAESPEKWVCDRENEAIAKENQWIASRDGLEGMIIIDRTGKKEKIEILILELIEQLLPFAKSLNCVEELVSLKPLMLKGNGAVRQRAIFQQSNSLKDVVRQAIEDYGHSFGRSLNETSETKQTMEKMRKKSDPSSHSSLRYR